MSSANAVMDAGTVSGEKGSSMYAYRSMAHKAKYSLLLLIPIGWIGFLVLFCVTQGDDYALDYAMPMTTLVRVCLVCHGLYFLWIPFAYELFIETLPLPHDQMRFGRIPENPNNLFWQMSCVSAELFFVGTVLILLVASQETPPRWAYIAIMAQTSYNMKNDLIWCLLGKIFSPEGKPIYAMYSDWLLIAFFFIVYIHHFFTA